MEIHISRKGEQFGPHPEAVVRQYLETGKFFMGRRKGVYQFVPGEPPSNVEVIDREDHPYSILYAHPTLDEDGEEKE